ncbi:MAG TPA: hypothetical protein VNY74_01470 [Edaphobacter sp.]|jgi:hypothetical protein|nr:hypothetical protein [Edaphobacter sp.]
MSVYQMSSLTKAYGILCVGFGGACGLAWIANLRTMRIGGPGPEAHDISSIRFVALFLILLGVALLMKWLWAHLLFVVVTSAAGIWLISDSVFSVPFPFLILTLMYGAGFLVPLTLSLASWRKARLTRNGI